MFESILEKMTSGNVPEGFDSISDCLMHVFADLVACYMTGDTKDLRGHLDKLVNATQNRNDVMLKDLNFVEKEGLLNMLNTLKGLKDANTPQQPISGVS